MTVRIAAEAERHIDAIDVWWRIHRQAAPDLFLEALADALELIDRMPGVGRPWSSSTVPGVRRVLLHGTRHHVYYVERPDHALVLAVWGAARGVGPAL